MLKILSDITVYSFALPVFVGLWSLRRLDTLQRYFMAIVSFALIMIIIEEYYSTHKYNNHFIINIDMVSHGLLMIGYFYIAATQRIKWIIGTLLVSFLAIVVYSFSAHGMLVMNQTISFSYRGVLLTSALLVLYDINKSVVNMLSLQPAFWISTAVIIYCSGTILLGVFTRSLLQLPVQDFMKIWSINWIASIIQNILFTISLSLRKND